VVRGNAIALALGCRHCRHALHHVDPKFEVPAERHFSQWLGLSPLARAYWSRNPVPKFAPIWPFFIKGTNWNPSVRRRVRRV
jgi:hypothetical protein